MEENQIKRIMPYSQEAEQSVIGSMFIDQEAVAVAMELITGEDFYHKAYGVVFDAMVSLYNEGKAVDLVTLQNRLKENGAPDEISSLEYVADLVSATPTSANVRQYAQIVQDKSQLRRMIRANEEIANTCYAQQDKVENIMEDAEKQIFGILQRTTGSDFMPIKDIVVAALRRIEKAGKQKGNVIGLPTGFTDLDYKTSGFQPSELILIAARPSMGKTALVLNIAAFMAFRQNLNVAVFSLEMSKDQLMNRLLAQEYHVD